ncbi:ankyrin repeat-containing-like protein [Cinnamomum micranthum f. kanehirae]|uniref:Ankyrin repeat-containing-like protein n=1 Tax=Cinnamomum micranthum f. kanehirae TaxID=337451 RepID=A0A3S3P941_9MAGN|nr:ankyrin repeat-containing-like protein [Cinnamomum micranthum f. kanehirae]
MEEDVFEVCAMGDTLRFQRLVQEDESVLTQTLGRARHTPLHLACKFKHNELASFILGLHPALAKAKNDKEETPLHEASKVGELDIVKQLLDACPCVAYMLNRDRESSLFIACSFGHSEVAWELCSRMDFLAWDEIGASCLQIAASKGYTEIVRKIQGENPSLASRKDEKGFSALHLASSKGNLGVIKVLLGKDPNLSFLRDNDGRTPLHLAIIYNQVHVVAEFLLERTKPASFNTLLVTDLIKTTDNNGDMVLHLAAKMNCLEVGL